MTEKQLSLLDSMINETYMYNGRNLTVKSYAVNNGTVRIINDGHPISFKAEKMADNLKEFLPVEKSLSTNGVNKLIDQQDSNISEIEKILTENIKKLQGEDGEKYIAQAREITSTTNAVVKLNRLKLDMFKEARKNV